MAALSAQDPLDAEPLGLGIYLGVEAFLRLARVEEAEVTALRGVGAPCVVNADFVKEGEVAEKRKPVRIAKKSAEGATKSISAPFLLMGRFTVRPVMPFSSSTANSSVSFIAWGGIPRWFPVLKQLINVERDAGRDVRR